MTPTQKKFFKIWNQFLTTKTCAFDGVPISHQQLPLACASFVKAKAATLQQEGLRDELICHLFNLCAEGHIGRVHMTEVMALYNGIVVGQDGNIDNTKERGEKQQRIFSDKNTPPTGCAPLRRIP